MKYKNLWKHLNALVKSRAGFVSKKKFNMIARLGKVEDLYYLTRKGSDLLIKDGLLVDPNFPKGEISGKDYNHRKGILDFQIQIEQWCSLNNEDLDFFLRYFDGDTGSKSSATALKSNKNSAIADAIFKIDSNLFVMELHNGNDSKRAVNQIHQHAELLTSLHVHKQFDLPTSLPYKILFLFENEGVLQSTIKRLQEQAQVFHQVERMILFKSIEELQNDPWTASWRTIFGNPYSITIKKYNHD